MAFSIATHDLATIRSYAQAKTYLVNTKPVRTTGNVPLRDDRRGHREFYIRTMPTGAIACRLYHTDVVTYYPDGRVHIDTSYASQSTNAFANQFTPHAVSCFMERGQPVVRIAGKTNAELFICPPGGLLIRPASDSHPDTLLAHTTPYTVTPDDNPALSQQCEKRLNLSRAARARAHLRPLLDYARTLEACGPMPHSAWQAMRGDGRLTYSDLSYLTPEDISPAHQDRWPEIVSLCCINQFSTGTVRVNTNLLRERLTTSLYRQLDVYDYVPLEWGTLPRDIKKYRVTPRNTA
jgi:hypothetical protein